ncbi:MAG: carboxypeptidase-like regulatory domain-containing protein, partial [Vicinamibacterales bacterium]
LMPSCAHLLHNSMPEETHEDARLLSIHVRNAAEHVQGGGIEMRAAFALGWIVLASSACHAPVITTDPGIKAGGTIAGIVRATDGSVPLVTRKVTAIHAASGARFETTTGVNGGYTIKVPEVGRYRIEVELREGEVIAKGPGETEINNGDLDPGRDFEITVAAPGKKSTL